MDLRNAGRLSVSGLIRADSGLTYSLVAAGVPLSDIQTNLLTAAGYPDAPSSQNVYFGDRGSQFFPGVTLFDSSVNYELPIYRTARPWLKFDVYNLFNDLKVIRYNTTVVPDASFGTLIGCATSGCHSPGNGGPAAGLDFTDPDASYHQLVLAGSNLQTCNGTMNTQVPNPSGICGCASLVLTGDGKDSLVYQLMANNFNCPNPDGGVVNPMPIDDAGTFHPLSNCLVTQVRQWIDQGALY